ncbi:MAG: hypothetical protein ACFB0C_02230 [Leptolyngbyaceae cyanobacterium]
MTTDPINTNLSQPNLGRTSILGLLFFMMGAPHLYAAIKPSSHSQASFGVPRYVLVVALAGAIASLVELSVP